MNIWRWWQGWLVRLVHHIVNYFVQCQVLHASLYIYLAANVLNCLGKYATEMWQSRSSSLRVIEKELQENDEDDEEEESSLQGEPGCDVIESGDVGVLFLEQLKLTSDPNERTDFPNFRSLLWRSMAQFPDRVEPRSRELSPLLLRFTRLVFPVFSGIFRETFLPDWSFSNIL